MARRGSFLAQTLLSKLVSSPSPLPSARLFAVFGIRSLCSGTISAPPLPSGAGKGIGEEDERPHSAEIDHESRKVAVFWDLDNKPPRNVPPYDAAVRLIEMAAGFGEVVDVAAYANRYAFAYLPLWVKEQRKERRQLDRLERAGIIKPSEPYVCGYCGRKCKTNEKLKKHFRDLHERERNKRMNRMNSLKGNKRLKYRASLSEKEERYRAAAKEVLVPQVGYGLAGELRRAGVYVRMVSDKSQAADEALKSHMNRSIRQGVDCICLVSDDSDFANILKLAQSKHLHTVVVGDSSSLSRFADEKFSWRDVASGAALAVANEIEGQWSLEDGYKNGFEDRFYPEYERRRARTGNNWDFSISDSDSEEDLDRKSVV